MNHIIKIEKIEIYIICIKEYKLNIYIIYEIYILHKIK